MLIGIARFSHIIGLVERPLALSLVAAFATDLWDVALPLGITLELLWLDVVAMGSIIQPFGGMAFLLLFIAHLYEKKGSFTLRDVFEKNAAKMIHRHPHVFAGEHFANLDEQLKAWEKLKQEEHKAEGKPTGVFDSLPRSLDPLARAYRIHSKAARTGFTWETREDVEQQVEEEWLEFLDAQAREDEKAIRHELGDLIFSIVELGRRNNLKANAELDAANERFLSRFRFMEEAARKEEKELSSMPLEEMDKLWAKAKEEEQGTE